MKDCKIDALAKRTSSPTQIGVPRPKPMLIMTFGTDMHDGK